MGVWVGEPEKGRSHVQALAVKLKMSWWKEGGAQGGGVREQKHPLKNPTYSAKPMGKSGTSGLAEPTGDYVLPMPVQVGGVCPNSMDAVSDRDYVMETVFFASVLMTHLSRWAQLVFCWELLVHVQLTQGGGGLCS